MRDVIVIFGARLRPDGQASGTLRRRVDGAFAFGRSLGDTLYLVTGAAGRCGSAEADVMRDLLVERGVAVHRIIVEPRSRDTFDSAVACWRILRQRGDVGRTFIASSRYHIPRCRMLLRFLGVATQPVPMPDDRPALGVAGWLFMLCREAAAVPYDAVLMLARRRRLLRESLR